MNGRIFDPVLARFLSADPNIDGVSDSQGYNRYSYVHNNPLNATDPSGYLSLKEVLPAIVAVVVTAVVLVATAGSGAGATAGFWAQLGHALGNASAMQMAGAAAAGDFCSGFSGSLLNGGNIGDAFKAGVIGGVTGAVTGYISNVIGGVFGHNPAEFDLLRELGRAASHGLVGGAVSEAQGGSFRHGFYSSAASSMFSHSPVGKRLTSSSHIAVRTATAATVGGTVSAIAGGKFANGAVTSAFQHLFNSESRSAANSTTGAASLLEVITPRELQVSGGVGGTFAYMIAGAHAEGNVSLNIPLKSAYNPLTWRLTFSAKGGPMLGLGAAATGAVQWGVSLSNRESSKGTSKTVGLYGEGALGWGAVAGGSVALDASRGPDGTPVLTPGVATGMEKLGGGAALWLGGGVMHGGSYTTPTVAEMGTWLAKDYIVLDPLVAY